MKILLLGLILVGLGYSIDITVGERNEAAKLEFAGKNHVWRIFSAPTTVSSRSKKAAKASKPGKDKTQVKAIKPTSFLQLDEAEAGKPASKPVATAKKAKQPAKKSEQPDGKPIPLSVVKFDKKHWYTTHNALTLIYQYKKAGKGKKGGKGKSATSAVAAAAGKKALKAKLPKDRVVMMIEARKPFIPYFPEKVKFPKLKKVKKTKKSSKKDKKSSKKGKIPAPGVVAAAAAAVAKPAVAAASAAAAAPAPVPTPAPAPASKPAMFLQTNEVIRPRRSLRRHLAGLHEQVTDLDSSLTALLQESEHLTDASSTAITESEGDMEGEEDMDMEEELDMETEEEMEEQLAIEQQEESEWAKQQAALGDDSADEETEEEEQWFEADETEAQADSESGYQTDELTDEEAEEARSNERESAEVQKRRFTASIHFNRLNVTGTVRVKSPNFVANGQQQWVLVASDDFHRPRPKARGWSEDARQECGGSPDFFLGGYCRFSDKQVTRTFGSLPVHTHIRLTARMHFFDKWEGQYAFVKLNDKTVWLQNHRHCSSIFASSCKGISVCGDDQYADRLSTFIDVVIPHDNRRQHPKPVPVYMRFKQVELADQDEEEEEEEPVLLEEQEEEEDGEEEEEEEEETVLLEESEQISEADGPVSPNAIKTGKSKVKRVAPNFKDRDTITVTFGAAMPGVDPCVASWGIDDVQIYTMLKEDSPRPRAQKKKSGKAKKAKKTKKAQKPKKDAKKKF